MIEMTKPDGKVILWRVSEKGYTSSKELIAETDLDQTTRFMEVLSKLIKANILRNDVEGCVTWHGGMQSKEFGMLRRYLAN